MYVSDGYDFNPFQDARLGLGDPNSPFQQNDMARSQRQMNTDADGNPVNDPLTSQQKQNEEFADADLAMELGELTRAANRANATMYTLDARGLVAGPDLDEQVDTQEWGTHIRKTQDSLRMLADLTGGIAMVNQNDFDKVLKRIDSETSDYYVLGYYSKNPDITKRRRQVEVRLTRTKLHVWSRKEYVLKPTPPPAPTKTKQ